MLNRSTHSGKATAMLPAAARLDLRLALEQTPALSIIVTLWADEEYIVGAWQNLFIHEEGNYIIGGKRVELEVIVLSKTARHRGVRWNVLT